MRTRRYSNYFLTEKAERELIPIRMLPIRRSSMIAYNKTCNVIDAARINNLVLDRFDNCIQFLHQDMGI